MYINFTYKNPDYDFKDATSLYENGDVNVKYTLMVLRDKLNENLQRINKLIDVSENIDGLLQDHEGVIVWAQDGIREQLHKDGVIRGASQNPESDSDSSSEEEVNHETHSERLRMINNMLNTGWNRYSDRDSESETESSDVVEDIFGAMTLVDYYDHFVDENNDE